MSIFEFDKDYITNLIEIFLKNSKIDYYKYDEDNILTYTLLDGSIVLYFDFVNNNSLLFYDINSSLIYIYKNTKILEEALDFEFDHVDWISYDVVDGDVRNYYGDDALLHADKVKTRQILMKYKELEQYNKYLETYPEESMPEC